MKTRMWMMVAVGVFCGAGLTAMAGDACGENGQGGAKGGNRSANIAKIKEKREAKYTEKTAQWEKKHADFGVKLNERLAKNKKLSDADKAEILSFFEEQYGENTAFRDEQHGENMAFLDSLADSGLSKDQIKEKIKAHVATQKDESKEHRASQAQERKALREKIGCERKGAEAGAKAKTRNRSKTRAGGQD